MFDEYDDAPPPRFRSTPRRDYAPLVRAHAARADHVICVSQHTAADAERLLGLPRAKMAMQDLVKRARERGLKFECRTCHRNETRFDLREDARVWLNQLLASPT